MTDSSDDNLGKWLLITGIILVCPPLGLAILAYQFKSLKSNPGWLFAAVIIGIVSSMFICATMSGLSRSEAYGNSEILIAKSGLSLISVAGILCSPGLFYDVTLWETSIISVDSTAIYSIEGKDVISFDETKREYVLNFPEDRKFRGGTDTIFSRFSIPWARANIDKHKIVWKDCLMKGNLQEIERAKNELEVANNYLRLTTEKYYSVKIAFDEEVAKMNQKYSQLKATIGTNEPNGPNEKAE